MLKNVGGLDRVLRVVVGLALIVMAVTGMIGVWGWIGVVPLATGLAGRCPMYRLLGRSSCPIAEKRG